MSGLGDRVKGAANELKGAAKQGVGEQTNDPDLVAEGEADETRGKAQGIVGVVKDAVTDIKDTLKR